MSRADEVRARQRAGGPLKPDMTAAFMEILRDLNKHACHPWKQVGPCVYCDTCNVRLYQGEPFTDEEKQELRAAITEADG
jgi:hypothetical protein